MSALDLDVCGKNLRTEIERTYQELKHKGSLRFKTPIDQVVSPYIPEGISFDDADAILRGAGFKTAVIDYSPGNSSLIGTTKLSNMPWFATADVVIDVVPKIPKDFRSSVGRVVAFIDCTTL